MRLYGPLVLPPCDCREIEDWARCMWFAAYREIYRRERDLYPEYIDHGGE